MINSCFNCDLAIRRTQMVMMSGNIKSGILLIGESPKYKEDKTGVHFTGKAGLYMRKIIKLAGFDVDKIAMTTVVKCKPSGNRAPFDFEINACMPILQEEINSISKDILIIVPLGGVALKTVLGRNASITKLRGKLYDFGDKKLLPMFHPSYVLNDINARKLFVKDWVYLSEYYKMIVPSHINYIEF